MAVTSAGLLPYRRDGDRIEVLLVHPGGPFWSSKDDGAWSIAKGVVLADEAPLDAAIREFAEETGHVPTGSFEPLAPIKQPGGKLIYAWITADDWDAKSLVSNTFTLEWPRHSGRMQTFPEVDRIEWFEIGVALRKILVGQRGFLLELRRKLLPQSD